MDFWRSPQRQKILRRPPPAAFWAVVLGGEDIMARAVPVPWPTPVLVSVSVSVAVSPVNQSTRKWLDLASLGLARRACPSPSLP